MHSGGFELIKLTYTRLEDNLILHRGDRLLNGSGDLRCHADPPLPFFFCCIFGSLPRPLCPLVNDVSRGIQRLNQVCFVTPSLGIVVRMSIMHRVKFCGWWLVLLRRWTSSHPKPPPLFPDMLTACRRRCCCLFPRQSSQRLPR